jgi:hypothetical protein
MDFRFTNQQQRTRVWEEWDENDYEIFHDGTAITQVTINPMMTLTRVSTTAVMVWMGWDDHDWEIFPTTVPASPRSPTTPMMTLMRG